MSLTYESFDSKWLDLHIDKQATVCFYQKRELYLWALLMNPLIPSDSISI